MREFRYNDTSRAFEDELEKELSEIVRESSTKQAEEKREEHSGIERIAQHKTPLEEVKAILEAKKRAPQELIQHAQVGKEMKKRASARRSSVDGFLSAAKN